MHLDDAAELEEKQFLRRDSRVREKCLHALNSNRAKFKLDNRNNENRSVRNGRGETQIVKLADWIWAGESAP